MKTARLLVVALALSFPTSAAAGWPDAAYSWVTAGPVQCSKTTDGGIWCQTAVDGLDVLELSSAGVALGHADLEVTVQVQGSGLKLERGTVDGAAAVRVSGTVSAVHLTRSHRGVAESVFSSFPLAGSTPTSGACLSTGTTDSGNAAIYVTRAGIGSDIIATGFAGAEAGCLRTYVDRQGLGFKWWHPTDFAPPALTLGAGGNVKLPGVNGQVLVSGGGQAFVDPHGSSRFVGGAVLVEQPTDASPLGAGLLVRSWSGSTTPARVVIGAFMDLPDDNALMDLVDDGALSPVFRLTLFDTSLRTVVIDSFRGSWVE